MCCDVLDLCAICINIRIIDYCHTYHALSEPSRISAMQAPQQPNPALQQGGERDYEQGGTLTGVQNLHTKDYEEETVQQPYGRSFAESLAVCAAQQAVKYCLMNKHEGCKCMSKLVQ